MSQALTDLIATLTLEPRGDDCFVGKGSTGDGADGTFGGHFLGQAASAAMASVPDDRNLHSIHAYFIRGGQPQTPIDYRVDRVRDGGSFSTRRVSAYQGGPVIFEMMASFSKPGDGRAMPGTAPPDFEQLPDPESLAPYHELMATQDPLPLPAEWALREHGVDVRVVNAPWAPLGASADSGIRMWIRAAGEMPDDARLHTAMLAYQSDESISDNTLVPFGLTWGSPDILFVSLDHAMWFHRPFRLDDWLFVEQRPVTTAHTRGLSTATVWNRDAQMVASFTQEALLRE